MQVLTINEFIDYLSMLLNECKNFENDLINTNSLNEQQRIYILSKWAGIKKSLTQQISTLEAQKDENSHNYQKRIGQG